MTDPRVWWECVRKVGYVTDTAKRRAARLGLNRYRCPHCEKWHLTKKASEPTDKGDR